MCTHTQNKDKTKTNESQRAMGNFLETMDLSIILIMVTISKVYVYIQTHQIVSIKYVQFSV